MHYALVRSEALFPLRKAILCPPLWLYIQILKVIIKIYCSLMSKTESTAARRKSAYICPKIVCIPVEYSLCAASPFGGSAGKTNPKSDELCEEEDM